jgi:hypothetical protein
MAVPTVEAEIAVAATTIIATGRYPLALGRCASPKRVYFPARHSSVALVHSVYAHPDPFLSASTLSLPHASS